MPKKINEDERRSSIADAALSIIAREGLESATFRAIAQERGLSLGAVQHSFADQAQLRQYVVSRFIQQIEKRLETLDKSIAQDISGSIYLIDIAISLLLELLPLDEKRKNEARIWESFTHASLIDSQIMSFYQQMDKKLDNFCINLILQLKTHSLISEGIDSVLEGIRLHALLDGLTLRLLTGASAANKSAAEAVLRYHIASLAQGRSGVGRAETQ